LVKENNIYRLYINGILDKTVTGNTTATNYLTKMVFGNISPEIGANEGFLGKLDDYAIWNRALSQSEITTVFNSNFCVNLLTLNNPADNISSGEYIKAASISNGKIIANNQISGNAKVAYNAKSIELNTGFSVANGSVFSTNIGTTLVGCN
jgi:hypothetical protein